MGENREVVEALIHYCNIYAAAYKPELMEYQGVSYSYAQIQVLEYVLETEDAGMHMSAIASRLGISRSNFTKIVNKLVDKGLLEKQQMPGNRKNLQLSATDFGRELYSHYAENILKWHFQPMFNELKGLSTTDKKHLRDALYAAMEDSSYRTTHIDT